MRPPFLLLAALALCAIPAFAEDEKAPGPWIAAPHHDPWKNAKGNPAVVYFVGYHAEDRFTGTNAAFHVGGGVFLTCVHAFENFEFFEILTTTGARARVDRIAAYDRSTDVAVFTVDRPMDGLAVLELADREAIRGEPTTLCGFPAYCYNEQALPVFGQWAVPGWGDLLMMDGIAEPGNSGGPILDGKGRVLGMLFRSVFTKDTGHEVGPLTHAVAARGLAPPVAAGRAALKEGRTLPMADWVSRGRDPWSRLPTTVHRALCAKEYGIADKAIQERLADHPKEARTLALLSELRRAKGDLEGAADAVDAALAADPADCRSLFELGQIKEAWKEGASAVAAYEQCSRSRRPGMEFGDLILVADAHGRRAWLLENMGMGEEAARAYADTLAICPYLSCETWHLGDVLGRLERTAEARDAYRRSLALRPDRPLVVLRLAIAESTLGDGKAALEDARRAVAMDGKSAVARFALGCFAWKQGRTDEAREQIAVLRELESSLAVHLAELVAGREDRLPTFTNSASGAVRVQPTPPR